MAGIDEKEITTFVEGDTIRDWILNTNLKAIYPYLDDFSPFAMPKTLVFMWPLRSSLRRRLWFQKTQDQRGLKWFEYGQLSKEKFLTPLSIAYGEIATHNHFVLDRGGKVFKQTAPVIKLPAGATEDEHLALLGLLNSSTACFWMKQVAHQKQMTGGDGIRIESKSKVPYAFSGTQLGQMPIPDAFSKSTLRNRLLELSRKADECGRKLSALTGSAAIEEGITDGLPTIRRVWKDFLQQRTKLRSQLILLQEEMDFTVYCMFGLGDKSLLLDETNWDVILEAGDRPFCILAGKNEDGFTVPSDIPANWPEVLQVMWKRRMEFISRTSELRLIEDAHYKRRWIGRQGLFNHNRTDDELGDACFEWMLNRLETPEYWPTVELQSVAKLADRARSDADFMQVAELYRGRPDFDVTRLIAELVESEAVPFLPEFRYKPTGLRNRQLWEQVWELQRREDRGEAVGEIPVPPKYKSSDFLSSVFWRLRGKLDVPKERFISYPKCERDTDPTLVVGWAGWDHLQQAQAVATWYEQMRTSEGWSPERLKLLLDGLRELLPWLKQWHNTVDPMYGVGMGDYFADFVQTETRAVMGAVRAQ